MRYSYSLIKRLLPEAPPRKKLIEALNLYAFEAEGGSGDCVEISLPANRYSDVASHVGIAREAAAIFGLSFIPPTARLINIPEKQGLMAVTVANRKLCPRYAGRYFELSPSAHSGQGKVGVSPQWLKKVLATCGIKPTNAVVDVMNYVMLETGQPLHVFDADKIKGVGTKGRASRTKRGGSKLIIVRKAKKGERLKLLDGTTVTLAPEMLVIADGSPAGGTALALAGIKGGMRSGVTAKTRRIIVEAANFNAANVYRTARSLKLRTDASVRFAHGLSPALVEVGLDRAAMLLEELGAELKDSVDVYPKPAGEEVIGFSADRFARLIGTRISAARARQILKRLGFAVLKKRGGAADFLVRVPAWRTDVTQPEDLIEEVARIVGYNNIPAEPPSISIRPAEEDAMFTFQEKVRRLAVRLQLDEVRNSSFVSGGKESTILAEFGKRDRLVELENPIAKDKTCLRPSLAPLLLENIVDNFRFYRTVRIFEIGKVFRWHGTELVERWHLGFALASKETHLILELKGIVEEVLKGVGVVEPRMVERGDVLRIESGERVLGELQQVLLKREREAALCELDLERILAEAEEEKEFVPLSRYPAVMRDISVLLSPDVRIGQVVGRIQGANRKLIENVDLIDEFYDEKVTGGKHSITFRVIFQAQDRTLTDSEVNLEMEKIAENLRKHFDVEVR